MSSLKILVPIKRVIDYAIKPRVNKTGTAILKTGVKFSINPFCDIAVEEAVRIRERGASGAVIHAVSIGEAKAQDVLRTALAKGADSATLIESDDLEPLVVAKLLQKVVGLQESNLILLGKQAIDSDAAQTGLILAGLLDWPAATNASKVEVDGDFVIVTREVDGGEETLKLSLPAVVTTDLRLNEPRYATLPNMMKAKKKPLQKLAVGDLGIPLAGRLEVLKVEEPAARPKGVMVKTVAEVADRLA